MLFLPIVILLPLSTFALSLPLLPTLPYNHTISTGFQSCIPQFPPGHAQVPTAVYEDCIRGIILWGSVPGRDKPTTFSRNPERGYHLPHILKVDSCVFEIDLIGQVSDQVSTFSAISSGAGLLAKECVLKSPHTGGVAFVGEGPGIEIILHGRIDHSQYRAES